MSDIYTKYDNQIDLKSNDFLDMLRKLFPFGSLFRFKTTTETDTQYRDNPEGTGGALIQDHIIGSGYESWNEQITTTSASLASSKFGALLSCFANELYLLHVKALDLWSESIPGLAVDTLEDWERILGVPDECTTNYLSQTTSQRQNTVAAKYYTFNANGLNKQFYIDFATNYGFTITVADSGGSSYNTPFVVGISKVGDRLINNAGISNVIITITAGDTALVDQLKCNIDKLKPSHVAITYIVSI